MRRRLLVVPALVAALVPGVAGCGADSPKPGPVAESSKPPRSADQAPSYPTEAQSNTPKAARAFVHHYVALINYSQRAGEVDELKKLSADSCSGCKVVIRKIEQVYRANGQIKGIAWKAEQLSFRRIPPKALIVAQVSMSAGSIDPSDTATVVTDFKAIPRKQTQFGLTFSEQRWVVTDLVQP